MKTVVRALTLAFATALSPALAQASTISMKFDLGFGVLNPIGAEVPRYVGSFVVTMAANASTSGIVAGDGNISISDFSFGVSSTGSAVNPAYFAIPQPAELLYRATQGRLQFLRFRTAANMSNRGDTVITLQIPDINSTQSLLAGNIAMGRTATMNLCNGSEMTYFYNNMRGTNECLLSAVISAPQPVAPTPPAPVPPSPVPLPASLPLLAVALGLGGVFAARRRLG